ncbi:pentatricopeptide repeat-containing protein-like protein [Bisporella sp. PMI_857]|nr:pentatricopeptide repeat-containing protein-like protein [Bisporella sp. PMI_857]
MSLLCSSSTTGTVISKVVSRQALSFLCPAAQKRTIHHSINRHLKQLPRASSVDCNTIEAWFFSSLANVSQCREHRPRTSQPSAFFTSKHIPSSTKRRSYGTFSFFRRRQHTETDEKHLEEEDLPTKEEQEENRTREELLALVDQYSGTSFTDQLPLIELPRLHQPSDGPHLTISDKVEDEWPPPYQEWPADVLTIRKLDTLTEMLSDFETDPEVIYQLYQDLPEPRAPYLPSKLRHKLLRHLAVVEKKDEQSMLRYFSVINDMKSVAIPLTVGEWTSATSFAARWVKQSTEVEVEAALHVWREMEHFAGVSANEVTFNVLYDVACKAGKFPLAEKIHEEMKSRGLRFTRFSHVGQIYLNGIKGDGDGVRAAFKRLESAREIIDTVVLNALLAAFARCDEGTQVEQIYSFMKQKAIPDMAPKTFLERRVIDRTYLRWAEIIRENPSKQQDLQAISMMGPNGRTYRILFNYFAVDIGDLDKTALFLDDLMDLKVPLHGTHFLAFFRAFATHGGIRYTKWTASLLERTWEIYLTAVDDDVADVRMNKWIILWSLRAFAKCSGKSRMITVWEEVRDKWGPDEAELEFIMRNLRALLKGRDVAEKHPNDWILGSRQ